jgi:hypothetical protein
LLFFALLFPALTQAMAVKIMEETSASDPPRDIDIGIVAIISAMAKTHKSVAGLLINSKGEANSS